MYPKLDLNSECNPALTLILSVTINIHPMLSLSSGLSLKTTGWSINPTVEATKLT